MHFGRAAMLFCGVLLLHTFKSAELSSNADSQNYSTAIQSPAQGTVEGRGGRVVFGGGEVAEARVFAEVLQRSCDLARLLLRLVNDGVQTLLHTLAGLAAGPLKAAGSVLRFVGARAAGRAGRLTRPKAPHERMPRLWDHSLRFAGRWVARAGRLAQAAGDALLLGGETVELLSGQLTAATADSFRLLDSCVGVLRRGLSLLVSTGEADKATAARASPREYARPVRGGGGGGRGVARLLPVRRRGPVSAVWGAGAGTASRTDTARLQPSALDGPKQEDRAQDPHDDERERESQGGTSTAYELYMLLGAALAYIWRVVVGPVDLALRYCRHSPPLLVPALCLVAFVARRKERGVALLALLVLLLWLLLTALSARHSLRLLERVRADAVAGYVFNLVRTAGAESAFESCAWLNALLGALWSVEGAGGLGAYVGEAILDSLNAQLALVPPGVARVNIRKFSLGSRAPVVTQIRVYRHAAPVCLGSAALREERGGAARRSVYSGCERAAAELDLAYVSEQMDIALTMRPTDAQSLLPEVTVTLSAFSLFGRLKVDAELIPDYPFVGNATLGFVTVPVTDLSLYSLGGVELTNLPGLDQWLNGSISWLLSQYTSPHSTTLDLQHTICPSCGAPPPPSPLEVFAEAFRSFANTTLSLAQGARRELRHITALVDTILGGGGGESHVNTFDSEDDGNGIVLETPSELNRPDHG